MKISKLELKSIHHSATLSQETHAFSANIYVNGKKVGQVRNEGHGGCDLVHLEKDSVSLSDLNKYCLSIEPPKSDKDKQLEDKYQFSVTYDFEIWCCEQVNRFLAKKELRSKLKSNIVLIEDGKVYMYRCKPTAENIKTVKKRDKIKQVLNEMNFDDALDAFLKVA